MVLRAVELAGGGTGPPILTTAGQIWTLYGDSHAGDAIAGETEHCEDVLKDQRHRDGFFGKDLMFGGWSTGSATKAQ